MKYVTAIDLSEKWEISSRMIAIHCKNGRISGAIKRGNLWLIPANAQKPVDERKSIRNIVTIDENIAEKGAFSVYNKAENDNPRDPYYARGIYEHFGLTRHTIQYYEKIGLIEPKRNSENLYREFDFYDLYQLMAIDFYRKRGFSLLKIKKMMKPLTRSDNLVALKQQEIELAESISEQQCIFNRLRKTRKFYENVDSIGEHFEIKDLPLYSVLKSFDDARDISNYDDTILSTLDGEDLLSNLIWAISFDNTGFIGQTKCIVKKITEEHQDSREKYLESGRCIYTAGLADEFFAKRIFLPLHEWAKEQGLESKGLAYSFLRFITLEEKIGQQFIELWIPVK